MKKNYFPAIALSYLVSLYTYGQDVISGGNMENPDVWQISLLNTDADNTVTYEFNYTATTPAQGSGGCLYVYGTNTGTSGGNLTNVMFYQEVTLQRGVNYTFDGAYKDIRTNNFWTEVYVGGNEPAEGSDYGTDQGAVLISGFKSTNWESACPSDEFDGTFLNDACIPDATNPISFEGEGDTTVYFGFRSGIYDDGGSEYTFEVFVDNISLTSDATSAVGGIKADQLVIAPNPFNEQVTITSPTQIKEISVMNVIGQSVYHRSGIESATPVIDLSNAEPGIYHIMLTDEDGNTFVRKSIKL